MSDIHDAYDPVLYKIAELNDTIEYYYDQIDVLSNILKVERDVFKRKTIEKTLSKFNYQLAEAELDLDRLEDSNEPY